MQWLGVRTRDLGILSAFAGQTVTLALPVEALGDNANDWASWLRLVILTDPAKGGARTVPRRGPACRCRPGVG